MEEMARQQGGATINVYAMHTRLTTPPVNVQEAERNIKSPCEQLTVYNERVDINSAMIDTVRECSQWLTKTFGTNGTNAYALDSTVRDVVTGLQQVQTQKLKTNKNVYLLATTKTTWIAQRLQSIPNITIAGYIRDTPQMMKFPLTRDEMVGNATSRYLDSCDAHVQCRTKYANLSISMPIVLKQLEDAVDKPNEPLSRCTSMLKNAMFNGDRDLKPSHGLRRVFALLRNDPVGFKYAPPLLYRVHRCHGTDEKQIEKILKRISLLQESQAAFAEQAISFSEFWPTPTSSRDALVGSFEKSLVSDGAMVAQQPLYCLFAASDSDVCTALFQRTPEVNESLKLSYLPTTRMNESVSNSLSSDVLILTSRLNARGSSIVARDLYSSVGNRTTVLIESDNILNSELDGPHAATLSQIVGLFVTKQAKLLNGKWRLEDLVTSATDWSKVAPAASTYGSPRPVTVNFTLTNLEMFHLLETTINDPYDYVPSDTKISKPTSPPLSSDDDRTPYGYYALWIGGMVLVFVYMIWAKFRGDDEETPPPSPSLSLHVNILHVPPSQPFEPPLPPLAVPMPMQPLPSAPPARVVIPSARSPTTQVPPNRWVAEPVNEYTYSYTRA